MKFQAIVKQPDIINYAIKDHLEKVQRPCCCGNWHINDQNYHESCCPECGCKGVGECEDCDLADDLIHEDVATMHELMEQFISNGEYLTVEFDTETNTATIVKR